MIHEFTDGLCVHCGLPPRYAPPGEICQVNKYGAPAKRALAAIGLEYVGFEPRGMYATYQSPLSVGFCERMFWPQIEKILDLIHDPDRLRQRQESCNHLWVDRSMAGERMCFLCGKDMEESSG